MNRKPNEKLTPRQREKLEKYVKAFISKVPQVIIQSRTGHKKKHVHSSAYENDVFEIAIEDDLSVQAKVKEACSDISPMKEFCLSIETLLKTSEGDVLVLEAWSLRLVQSETFYDLKYRVYAELEIVISNLMMLLKSIIAVTRVIPAYKLSLGQSGITYVILYRVYHGEPQVHQLGDNYQKNKIGDVYTPIGTISVSVAYRSKQEMTIAPQSSGKENSFMVNSDYFNMDMSPKRSHSAPRIIKNRVLRNSTNSQNVGAFAVCSDLPEPSFPELAFLQKAILHPSRSCLNHIEGNSVDNDNIKGDLNSNLSVSPENIHIAKNEKDALCERLSCSDLSDGSDFVLIDTKPPFANYDPERDLNAFYQECQSAPPLSSFSNQKTLQEQVSDLTTELEKFEISMMDFDNFVDSVCQVDAET